MAGARLNDLTDAGSDEPQISGIGPQCEKAGPLSAVRDRPGCSRVRRLALRERALSPQSGDQLREGFDVSERGAEIHDAGAQGVFAVDDCVR